MNTKQIKSKLDKIGIKDETYYMDLIDEYGDFQGALVVKPWMRQRADEIENELIRDGLLRENGNWISKNMSRKLRNYIRQVIGY